MCVSFTPIGRTNVAITFFALSIARESERIQGKLCRGSIAGRVGKEGTHVKHAYMRRARAISEPS